MSAADPLRLTIVHSPEGWRILTRQHPWGQFAYRVDAEEAAIRLARKAREHGRDVEIWVRDLSGRIEGLNAA
jgi:hypothetical protein